MSKPIIFKLFVILLFVLTAGCSNSATLEESQEEAVEAVRETFESPVEDAKEETENFQFHLPSGATIKEKNANNVIIEDGNNTYILFIIRTLLPTMNTYMNSLYKMMPRSLNKKPFQMKKGLVFL
ncbi:hypothetical protein [Bacillus sp. SG-1]|uniref:hypothetical protein n=1 Tax=Bacillus sp. SG-1 TaxID=161544 RepID=UPI0001544613|nr:hypothetical protein [Bacillus sp. SG-1]EDL62565.1 hypothetical protein BSG1_09953 [Bacillus sp. SG-1]